MKTVKTEKGTELPLVNLKGKDYLQVAYRIQWFTEDVENFSISTEFLTLNENETVARATIEIRNEKGQVTRRAMATKREAKGHFSDHTEKAETGAIGRALAQLGYGTQFAISDLEEGDRLLDAPLQSTREAVVTAISDRLTTSPTSVAKPRSSFSKNRPQTETKPGAALQPTETDGWE